MDGFIKNAEGGKTTCGDPTDPACTDGTIVDVMGYHDRRRDPELLGLGEGLRPARPHVPAERLVEPTRSTSAS